MGKKDKKKKWGKVNHELQKELQKQQVQEDSLKREGAPLHPQHLQQPDQQEDSYQQINLQFMFLEPTPIFTEEVQVLLQTLFQGSIKDLTALSTKLSTDPQAVMLGYQQEDDIISICSITGLVTQHQELTKYVRSKLPKCKGASFLISQRVGNMPPSIVPKIYQALELNETISKIIVVSKACYDKTAIKKKTHHQQEYERLQYPKFEDYLFMKHSHQRAVFDANNSTGEPFVRIMAALTLAEFKAAVQQQYEWLQ